MSVRPATRAAGLAWRAAAVVLVVNVLAALLAVATDWRARFDPPPDQGSVASEWALNGSAISAPLAPLALLAAAALLARRADRRWGALGLLGIALAGAAFVVRGVGKGTGTPFEHTPGAVLVVAAVAHTAAGAAMVVLAIRDLIVGRCRSRPDLSSGAAEITMKGTTMSRSMVRWGAPGAALSGLLFVTLSLASLATPEPSPYLDVFFAFAWLSTVLPVLGLRATHEGRDGRLGTVGSVALVLGAVANFVMLIPLAVGNDSLAGLALPVGGLLLFVGLVALGIATLRARVLPRWCGIAMIAVLPLTFLSAVFPAMVGGPGDYPSVVVVGAFWLGLGYALSRSRSRQPIRA